MGTLYICATPIGNLEDVSIRLLKTLRQVDIIACEDTRQTAKLLQRYRIKARTVSYHRFNLRSREAQLIEYLRSGQDVALVSDAGMPAISDPGTELVQKVIQEGMAVVVIPGPSALISALAISGLDTTRFVFEGFLPAKTGQRRERLASLVDEDRTIVFYESPHRLLDTLRDIEQVLGERRIAAARELTKKFEGVVRGTVLEVLEYFTANPPRGEFTLVLEGKSASAEPVSEEDLLEEVEALIARGVEKKEAFKIKAREYGLSKRYIYKLYLNKTDK
jgi:16S rRNA (cytidine1402-2'-O)-methyltransferase